MNLTEAAAHREDAKIARLRVILFAATGLALPFFAFPPVGVRGKPVDLATIFAALFVICSLPSLRQLAPRRPAQLVFAGILLVPLLVLVPPRPPFFAPRQFALSYAHWLLLTAFFLCSLTLVIGQRTVRRLLSFHVVTAALVAGFGLYQTFGYWRRWPGTQWVILPFQREPFRFAWIGHYLRPTSIFLEPAWLGGYLAWNIGLALVLLICSDKGLHWKWLALLLLFCTLLGTLSWGGYADFLAVLLGFVFSLHPSRRSLGRWTVRALAAAAVLTALLCLSSPGRLVLGAASQRFRLLRATLAAGADLPEGMTDSSWVRFRGLQRSSDLVSQHPVRGIGLGQYELASDETTRRAGFANPWCGWVAIASEMGILGPILLIAPLLMGLQRMRRLGRGDPRAAATGACLAFGLTAQLHTGSFADLWWWYPVSLAAVLAKPGTHRPAQVDQDSEISSRREASPLV